MCILVSLVPYNQWFASPEKFQNIELKSVGLMSEVHKNVMITGVCVENEGPHPSALMPTPRIFIRAFSYRLNTWTIQALMRQHEGFIWISPFMAAYVPKTFFCMSGPEIYIHISRYYYEFPSCGWYTLQPLYNTVRYNTVFDITRFKDEFQKCIDYIEKWP